MGSWMATIKASGKSLDNLKDILVLQLKDLYDAEERLIEALPKMADASASRELKSAFEQHLDQTRRHKERLEEVFHEIGEEVSSEKCEAMMGIVEEGEIILKASGDAHVKDAALIGAAQRAEHYEIAGYGTARNFAHRLGHERAAELLQQTLDEEKETDERLTRIAESTVNPEASRSRR